MNDIKTSRGKPRAQAARENVLDAAERLLHKGKPDFSMRDLASEAGVSFATPFNHFGSKAAIMHALSERRIATMTERLKGLDLPSCAMKRVLIAVDTAVAVMLEEPAVNRAVMGWIGTAGPEAGRALELSTALWRLALDTVEDVPDECRQAAASVLPRQLAFAFRGTLSFWTAGELPDEMLAPTARDLASSLLRGACKTGLQSDSAP